MVTLFEKKRFLRNAVEQTLFMIESERRLAAEDGSNRGLTPDEIDQIAVKRIGDKIRGLRLIDNGYVWVNHIIDYGGGEKYALRLMHPNLKDTEGAWLSTETMDIKGNKPYQAELDGIKKDGELYLEYYFKKMGSNKISHKMSFAKLYKPFDWVVATGVYLDDVDQLIAAETRLMHQSHTRQIRFSITVAAAVILLSAVILAIFDRQIIRLIQSYNSDIQEYTNHILQEKEKTEQALEEVRQLSGLLPICASCKKNQG